MTIKIFLADDHAILRASLRFLLESQSDLKVIGDVGDGGQAVSEVRRLQPDVVILDISLPKLNGLEAARQIIENNVKARVIILSVHATHEYIFQALRAGVLSYVLKSAAGEEIIAATRAVYNGQRYFCRKIPAEVITDYLHSRVKLEQIDPISQLSPREREIIQWVAEGKSSADIANMLCLSTKTVETYRSRLMRKLNLNDLPSLVKFAIQHSLISLS